MLNRTDTFPAELPETLNRIAVLIFFIWAAVIFTTPVGEGDFFWHVKTGEWIWQHKALPTADPFSFTVSDSNPFNPGSQRIPFLLKQYWLGQLVFYGIWSAAGEGGMVAFRALCYTGGLVFLYRWASRYQKGLVPLLAVILVGSILRNYSNERPQIFAFLLLPLLIHTLEQLRKRQGLTVDRQAILLPLLMLVWSNCHASFLLGIVVIAAYAAGHLLEAARAREPVNRKSLALSAIAAVITLLNPNGFTAFTEFFSLSKNYTNLIAEYISPLQLAYRHGIYDYGYWTLLAAALLAIALCCRRMAPAHLLLLAALAGLSLSGTRYIPFFAMTAPIICCYIPKIQLKSFCRLLPLAAVSLLLVTADYRNAMKFRAERSFPEKASRFLTEANPKGNMFNFVSWGGYLLCYNRYPVFIDGRNLIEELVPVHNSILAGVNWQANLDRYGINFLIIPGTDTISLQAYPLLLQLLNDNSWALIYQDEIALILLRNTAANSALVKRYAMDKNIISSHIQSRWKWQMTNDF